MSECLRGAVGGPIVNSPMESRCGVLAPPELLNQAPCASLIVASPVWKGQVRNEPDHRPPSAWLASVLRLRRVGAHLKRPQVVSAQGRHTLILASPLRHPMPCIAPRLHRHMGRNDVRYAVLGGRPGVDREGRLSPCAMELVGAWGVRENSPAVTSPRAPSGLAGRDCRCRRRPGMASRRARGVREDGFARRARVPILCPIRTVLPCPCDSSVRSIHPPTPTTPGPAATRRESCLTFKNPPLPPPCTGRWP